MAFQFLTGEANLGTVNLPSGSNSRIPMNFSMDIDGRWIYCNYPERITSDSMFGDSDKGNVWLNQKTVSAGEAQIFYSHYNQYKSNIHYGIQIFNPNKTSVTITPLNCGHGQGNGSDSGRINVNAASWTRFFNGASDCGTTTAKTVASNGSFWILDKVIPQGYGFSGNLRFRTSGTVIVTVYAFLDRYKISGAGSQYQYDEASVQYSGYGAGYFLTAAEITIKASDVLNNGGKFFQTCYSEYPKPVKGEENPMEVNGKAQSDMVPIHIAGTSEIAGPDEPRPRHNVGNWCVQYYIPVRFENDTNRDVVFKGYIQPGEDNKNENFYILSSGSNNTVYQRISSINEEKYKDKRTWHWTNHTVPAHTTSAVQICQFILGTNSSKNVNHIWKVENK